MKDESLFSVVMYSESRYTTDLVVYTLSSMARALYQWEGANIAIHATCSNEHSLDSDRGLEHKTRMLYETTLALTSS